MGGAFFSFRQASSGDEEGTAAEASAFAGGIYQTQYGDEGGYVTMANNAGASISIVAQATAVATAAGGSAEASATLETGIYQ